MERIILYQILSISYNKVTIDLKYRSKRKSQAGVGFDFARQDFISRCYLQPYRADNITIDSRISGHRQPYLNFFWSFIKSARGQKWGKICLFARVPMKRKLYGDFYSPLTLINILRHFKNATFYVNHFHQIAGLILSTLSNLISAHHREHKKCFDQTVSSDATVTSALFKKTCLASGHLNVYRTKLASLIAKVLANKKNTNESWKFC